MHPPAQNHCLRSKARQQTRTITRPDIIAATFIAARVDSPPISTLVSVELRSSALDMARAPSGPKLFPAKQSASANTHNYTPGYHRSDFHCSQGRLTANIQAGERGVAFQPARYGTCTLRPKTIPCKENKKRVTFHIQVGERGVAFQHTRYGTCTLRPKLIFCKAKRVSKHAQLHARISSQRLSLQPGSTHCQ